MNLNKLKGYATELFNPDNYSKKRTVKITKYFDILDPKYSYLQITPTTSIRNYNSATIAKAIQGLYRTLLGRINFDTKPWTIEPNYKVSFYMYFEKENVEFYFIVPSRYEQLMREKIGEVWGSAKVAVVNSIPLFSDKALKYEIVYSKEDALSLSLDKKCNEPLNSIFNVLDIMQEGDRVGLFYNFIPTSQRAWRKQFNKTIDCIKENRPVDKEKFSPKYILKMCVLTLIDILDIVINTIQEFIGAKQKQKTSLAEVAITSLMIEDRKKLTSATANKKEATILDTQILLMSESPNTTNKRNNAIAVAGAFHNIANDNELGYKTVKTKFDPEQLRLNKIITNKMSVEECQNLLELPGRELLSKYTTIKKIDVFQKEVPKELRKGYMSLGNVEVKDTYTEAFLPSDSTYGNLPATMLGGEGEGKSTRIVGMAYESWKNKESVVVIDFIKKCEVSNGIAALITEKDIVIIDCSDNHKLPGLGYNEIKPKSNDPYDILEASSMRTEQFQALVDACNEESLSDQMLKYFLAASNIVNLHDNMSLSNIMQCLDSYEKRDEYIKYAEANEVFNNDLDEEIRTLRELDEIKDGKVIGTKYTTIKFIQNRITKLKSNRKLKLMYGKSCKDNVDLVQAILDKKIILIKLPQIHFGSPLSKNIAVTFFTTKLWAAAQIIGDMIDEPDRVNVIIDELYQCPMAEEVIGRNIDQARKFGHRYIFSCHEFKQLRIAPQLKNEGSYIFFHNINIADYKEFRELLDPYEYEDIKAMKQYHVLNLVKYRGGYASFSSRLPDPIIDLKALKPLIK